MGSKCNTRFSTFCSNSICNNFFLGASYATTFILHQRTCTVKCATTTLRWLCHPKQMSNNIVWILTVLLTVEPGITKDVLQPAQSFRKIYGREPRPDTTKLPLQRSQSRSPNLQSFPIQRINDVRSMSSRACQIRIAITRLNQYKDL